MFLISHKMEAVKMQWILNDIPLGRIYNIYV